MNEVDPVLFAARFVWCVYLHQRPDGSVFYVGKGKPSRANDFAPSRRTLWHRNIVAKHGRKNIGVTVIPCCSEAEAFALERAHISIARAQGVELANLTEGGEGTAGHKSNEKQLAALARGRAVGKRGVPGPRPQLEAWKATPEGILHLQRLSQIGRAVLHQERICSCAECGVDFTTHSAKAKCCGRLCEQRYRRAGKNK